MADLVFTIAKGRVAQWCQNVEDNSPAAAVIRFHVIDNNAETDANMEETDTITALLATLANEVTNSNYATTTQDETDIVITLDDSNDLVDIDISDITWSAVGAGTAWTDLIVSYDADGSDTDSTTVPMTLHDFSVTPDGSDITAQIHANGFFRAS